MKEQEQLAACAELDGWKGIHGSCHPFGWEGYNPSTGVLEHVPNYNSRDVLVELIKKAIPVPTATGTAERKGDFVDWLATLVGEDFQNQYFNLVTATPAQLREALLRATVKWKS